MHNRIICITGAPDDQGGELVSMLLVERSIYVSERPLLLISTPDPWDLGVRYRDFADIIALPMDSEVPKHSLAALIEALSQDHGRDVIIHLAAEHRDDALNQLHLHTAPYAEELNLTWVGAYLLGPSELSHDLLEVWWETGPGSEIDECVAVINLNYGDHHNFYWWDSGLRRDGWIDGREGEEMLHPLPCAFLRSAMRQQGPLLEAYRGPWKGDAALEKKAVWRWYDDNQRLVRRLTVGPQ